MSTEANSSPPPRPCREHTIRTSDHARIDRFLAEIYAAMEPALLAQNFVDPEFRISMVLREAVVNAWLHGNRKNRAKKVTVRWQIKKEELTLEVIDQGKGFPLQSIPDPRACENIGRSRGRGIAIITCLADRASWQDRGRHLTAVFARLPAAMNKH
ncbi:ATP-binding protein [Thiovibrio sp. JS02]